MRFSRYFLLIALGASIAGCEANNLYVAHETVIGVNASLSQDRQQGQLVIGYDRDFITIIPKAIDKGDGKKDVMALLNCTSVKVDGIFLSEYSDSLASGEAATLFATQLGKDAGKATGSHFFDCGDINKEQNPAGNQPGGNQQ